MLDSIRIVIIFVLLGFAYLRFKCIRDKSYINDTQIIIMYTLYTQDSVLCIVGVYIVDKYVHQLQGTKGSIPRHWFSG